MLAVLTTARLAMGFQFQSIGSAAPFLVEGLGIDYASIGFLIGLYLLPGVVLALLVMLLGGLIAGAGESYRLAVWGRLVGGVGAVLLTVLLTKMVIDWFAGREVVVAIAILTNSWPISIAIALATLGPLAEAFSWPAIFYATSAVAAAGLVLVVALYRSPQASAAADSGDAKIWSLSLDEVVLACLAGAVWALFNAAYVIFVGFAPSFLISGGASTAEAGLVVSLGTWLGVASVQIGGMIVQRYGRATTVMVVGIVVWGVGLLLLPSAPSPLLVIVVVGLLGGVPVAAIVSLPAEIFEPGNRGPGLGLFITWYYAASAALPPLAGWFRDLSGDAAAPLTFAGVVMLAALPLLGLFRRYQRRALRTP
jgi:predicted MFS family arabinose efflux permease